jgi:protein-L-isoaspartate(D-aspartate) O-methyltransferase
VLLLGPAFLAVDRASFIPDRIWCQIEDDGPYAPIDADSEPARWAGMAHSDRVIVTQFDDGRVTWPQVGHRPTCSASMPSAVTAMLTELDVQPGQSVLEIGTGTGYNAALLAELVGEPGRVTTIEVDTELAEQARARLTGLGYTNVEVVTADATVNLADLGRRYDRIIATAAVQVGHLPYTWVEHTNPGGVILAPMRAELASGPLVRFVVQDGGAAIGRACNTRVGFMELRSQRAAGAGFAGLRWNDDSADVTYTDVAPWRLLLTENPRWAIAVAVPNCRYMVWEKTSERPGIAWLHDPLSRSWATVARVDSGDHHIVRQHGPRRLWNEVETAVHWWQAHGEPPIETWKWTITPNQQTITLT